LTSESGVSAIIKLGEKFEIVATNALADHMFVAAPAVGEGEMFLRSKTHLFCVSDGQDRIAMSKMFRRPSWEGPPFFRLLHFSSAVPKHLIQDYCQRGVLSYYVF